MPDKRNPTSISDIREQQELISEFEKLPPRHQSAFRAAANAMDVSLSVFLCILKEAMEEWIQFEGKDSVYLSNEQIVEEPNYAHYRLTLNLTLLDRKALEQLMKRVRKLPGLINTQLERVDGTTGGTYSA
jgi:hypothetical protein